MEGRKFQYVLAVCFVLGVVIQNFLYQKQIFQISIFEQENLQLLETANFVKKDFMWYVIKSRIILLGFMLAPVCFKNRRLVACLYAVWIAFLGGIFVALSVLELGIAGILVGTTMLFPHYLLYGFAFLILFFHCYDYTGRRMHRVKILFFVLFYLTGIALEIYINPLLLKLVIHAL